MNTGRLDQRVLIERLTYEPTGTGGGIEVWAPVATV